MGLFLTMLSCKISSRERIIRAIKNIMKKRGLLFKSENRVNESFGRDNEFEITNVKNKWVQVFCPEMPDDDLAISLSKEIDSPVFQFHIHDGMFWMYQLYVSGELVDRHKPIPDYWNKISEKDKKAWKGSASTLSRIFKIPKEFISPYLVHWNHKEKEKKAFQKDQFPIENEWGMIDFQEKFGISYPNFEKPEELNLVRLTFVSKNEK